MVCAACFLRGLFGWVKKFVSGGKCGFPEEDGLGSCIRGARGLNQGERFLEGSSAGRAWEMGVNVLGGEEF